MCPQVTMMQTSESALAKKGHQASFHKIETEAQTVPDIESFPITELSQ